MPKDPRLYMTFPIDMHRHPKITRLDVAVRWAFVEMNGEARIADNDGVFAKDDAEFTWGHDVLDALVNSHPSRPLVVRTADSYVIRDYAEHQETRATREERRARNAKNGAMGGRPKKNPEVTDSVSSGLGVGTESQPNETQTKAESESESEDYYSRSKSQSLDNRAREETDTLSAVQEKMAARAGIDVTRIQAKVNDQLGVRITKLSALALSNHILDKAAKPPDRPTSYVLGSISRSPAEIEKHIYDSGLT